MRLRSGLGYEADLAPETALGRAFADLQVRIDALKADSDNEELHAACDEKLAHAARLTTELRLDGELRVAARHYVLETARWLAAMPVARRHS